jgi:hypothetical protein
MNTQKLIGGAFGVARAVVKIGVGAASEGIALVQRARQGEAAPETAPSAPAKADMDDATLARKVEPENYRESGVAKGKDDVSVVDGVVELRGEVKRPDDVRALEARTRAIPEVRGVQNLLHLAKTPSPTRADTPPRQQRASTTRRKTTAPARTGRKRTTAEAPKAKPAKAEPSPAEHAEAGTGRTPAPMGSSEPEEPKPATATRGPNARRPAGSPRRGSTS